MTESACVISMPIEYPESLPVSARREEIARALKDHQVVVVAGETGSGKTTQIPKICLDCGYGRKGLIGHTQPRRLAARSVAARIAEELKEPLGRGVGYQVRFNDHTGPDTCIKLMTDGILLNEIQRDRELRKYEVLIIDEAHERSLNIDFLLGYLRQLLARRSDLKVIITSATIDVEKFSAHFSNAPIISVSGRSFPVDVVYQDPEESEAITHSDDRLTESVLSALARIVTMDRERGSTGDVLVFLSGEREIRDVAQALRKRPLADTEVLPLYARLSQTEQKRIFQPHRGRRVVLSTNVAETSLTVPGIVYVVDSGLARISRYSVASKVQRLPIEPVSRASANQRAGRCGRVAPGVCIRLYSLDDYLSRPEFTDPEIQRTNLSAVILQMLLLRLGDIENFPFVEPPAQRAINDGFRLLSELGAIDDQRRITALGRKMARLPTDPRLARMLLAAQQWHCVYEMLIIVSALSIQDPREHPVERREAARQKHEQFVHPDSDFLSLVTLWRQFEARRQVLTQGELRRFCRDNFLNFMRMREWRETHRQLMLACQQVGIDVRGMTRMDDLDYDVGGQHEAVHRAILAGSLNQIGQLTDDRQYLGSRSRRFSLFPTSVLSRRKLRWVVTAELVETSRLFAMLAGRVEPEWIEDAAGTLVRREYLSPHWSSKRGEVMAWEKVSLFGVVLIEKRRVSYGAIDPVISRELFLREALVGQSLATRHGFLAHNRALRESIRRDEEKQRRPDMLVADEEIYAFYADRVPDHVNNLRSFEKWCRSVDADRSRVLHMERDDLLRKESDEDVQQSFPDHASIAQNRLKIEYRFSPGSDEDGVSIDVPAAILGSMSEVDLDWAVPGQLEEKAVALLKALPKSLRKQFMPIPDFVRKALQGVEPGKISLRRVLLEKAARIKGVTIDPAAWDNVELPSHLRTRIRVLDGQGKELALGRDLKSLQARVAATFQETETALQAVSHPLECRSLRDWPASALPEQVALEQGITLLRYPALVDEGSSVAVQLFDDVDVAMRHHRLGVARLLMLRTPQQRQLLDRRIRDLKRSLGLKLPGQIEAFGSNVLAGIYCQHFQPLAEPVRDAESFAKLLDRGRMDLLDEGERLIRLVEQVISLHFSARQRLSRTKDTLSRTIADDVDQQLHTLMPADFPLSIADGWLREYPRYFRALELRLEKLPRGEAADEANCQVLARLQSRFDAMCTGESAPSGLEDFPVLLQELRVSLFAQSLGTRMPVSGRRLERRLDEASRTLL